MKTYVASLTVITLLIYSCSNEDTSLEDMPPGKNQIAKAHEIGLETQNKNAFVGKTNRDGVAVLYSIEATSARRFEVKIKLDGHSIDATIDLANVAIEADGHGAILTEEQKDALLKTGEAISNYLLDTKGININITERTLLRVMEYWGKSPEGYTYAKNSYAAERSETNARSADEGIICITPGQAVRAEYDDLRGSWYSTVTTGTDYPNGYGCMGRCGADCGSVLSAGGILSAWTKDCMDHDVCSYWNSSSGGSSDANCGDEFDEAMDDWFFGMDYGC